MGGVRQPWLRGRSSRLFDKLFQEQPQAIIVRQPWLRGRSSRPYSQRMDIRLRRSPTTLAARKVIQAARGRHPPRMANQRPTTLAARKVIQAGEKHIQMISFKEVRQPWLRGRSSRLSRLIPTTKDATRPTTLAARKVIQAPATCSIARSCSMFFSQRMSSRRNRFRQEWVRSTTPRRFPRGLRSRTSDRKGRAGVSAAVNEWGTNKRMRALREPCRVHVSACAKNRILRSAQRPRAGAARLKGVVVRYLAVFG